jgi:hypothetical protein
MEGFAGLLCARKHTCKTVLAHKNPAVAHIVPLLTQCTGVLVNEIIIFGIRCAMLWVWMFMKDCNISGFPVQPRGVNMGQMENDELKLYQLVIGHSFSQAYHICTFRKLCFMANIE